MAGRSCLVLVYGSSNVLAAMASVRWYGTKSGTGDPDRVTVVVHPPASSGEMVGANAGIVERIIQGQGWPPPVVLAEDQAAEITQPPGISTYRETLRRFISRVGDRFDEVHFAHDFVGRVPELAMNAFPRAKRIVYGDTLGSMYDLEYFMALARGATINEARCAVRERPRPRFRHSPGAVVQRLANHLPGKPQALRPHRAVLVLPTDQTGAALAGIPMWVVPKSVALDIVADSSRVLPELAEHSHEILAGTPAPHYLLLLENYSDAGMTSFENEVAMYEAVVRNHVAPGATVVLKTHPLATGPVDAALGDRLAEDYSLVTVRRDLGRYPMELWSDLVSSCEVISMLSYCGISLAFLYGKSTIYPMTTDVVERFFPERSWDRVKDADTMYRGQLAALTDWDGEGLLWRGDVVQGSGTLGR